MKRRESDHRWFNPGVHARPYALALFVLMLWPTTGCGPVEDSTEPPASGTVEQEVVADNGLATNGLAFNGLATNGLAFNGLATNGLATNGLSSSAFASWFRSNPAMAEQVMGYVVRCAVPSGQTRTYKDSTTGRTYTWTGSLGLTPAWASGTPATETEQQLVSACLAAHANKYGVSVPISVLGRNANGAAIPYTTDELNTFPKREGCFFGNLFRDQGIYVGSEGNLLGASQSSVRACSLANNSGGVRTPCAPLQYAGHCSASCTLDSSGLYYASCTYGGITYRPLTTRLRDQEIYTCGDGTCQRTESCGTSNQYNNCGLDCGTCR
jgi:hypothetical protein